MSMIILGMGTALPESIIDRDDALALARTLADGTEEQESWLEAIYDGAGVNTRGFCLERQVVRDVLDGTNLSGSPYLPCNQPGGNGPTTAERMDHYARLAPPLAILSSNRALIEADIKPAAVTHLVTVSCTGFVAPGIDQAIIEAVRLSPGVARTHVGYMGCHGAFNGMRVAHAFMAAHPHSYVLLCATELCCLHYFYGWDPQKVIANALFADGSGAIVAAHSVPGATDRWQLKATGSCVFPDSAGAMTWIVGDNGFEMTLSRQVPAIIAEELNAWLAHWLGGYGLTVSDIRTWAVHPGGPKILDAVEAALSLPEDALITSREILAECGNMSSPTILFILERLMQQDRGRPCVALGFGPGLTVEAMLFE